MTDSTTRKQIYFLWHWGGITDYIRSIIALTTRYGHKAKIVPCIRKNNIWSQVFSWCKPIDTPYYVIGDKYYPVLDMLPLIDVPPGYYDTYNGMIDCLIDHYDGLVLKYIDLVIDWSKPNDFRWIYEHKYTNLVKERIKNIVNGDYNLIHVRYGDEAFENNVKQNTINTILQKTSEIVKESTMQTVLISDCMLFKEMAKEIKSLIILDTVPVHCGYGEYDTYLPEDKIVDILTDKQAIIEAKFVTTFYNTDLSARSAGGFAANTCDVFGIPYTVINV